MIIIKMISGRKVLVNPESIKVSESFYKNRNCRVVNVSYGNDHVCGLYTYETMDSIKKRINKCCDTLRDY